VPSTAGNPASAASAAKIARPGRRSVSGAAMPTPLRHIVQCESDHQERGERRLAGRERSADEEPFSKVVNAYPERDECRQRDSCGRGAAASSIDEEAQAGDKRSEPDYSAGLPTGCGTGGDFQSLLERVDQKEHEQPDGERQYSRPRRLTPLSAGKNIKPSATGTTPTKRPTTP
jgi:hypothetical protein